MQDNISLYLSIYREILKCFKTIHSHSVTHYDIDKYDRRKPVGTNSLSDVWGLGCLFFELLTGEVLFETEEYIEFHFRLT